MLRAALAAVVACSLLLFTHVTERAFERASRVDRIVEAHTGPPAAPQAGGTPPPQR